MISKCPHCHKKLNVPDVLSGQEGVCTSCHSCFTITEMPPEVSVVAEPAILASTAETDHQGQATSDESQQYSLNEETRSCPFCCEEISAHAHMCDYCGESLVEQTTETANLPPISQMPPSHPSSLMDTHSPYVSDSGGGKAIASLVLGIISVTSFCIPLLGFPISITGLILGASSMKPPNKGMAIAGFILSIIGLTLTLLTFIGYVVASPF